MKDIKRESNRIPVHKTYNLNVFIINLIDLLS